MKSTPVTITRKPPPTPPASIPAGGLSFDDAMVSPCQSCATSPCCRFMPLRTMTVETLMDLDYCRYLLNFDGMELGLRSDGRWSVSLHRACGNLDPSTMGCTVHGTDAQPHICVHYNEYSCWYRSALSDEGRPDHIRINRARLEAILPAVVFDDERRITAVPAWEWLQETLDAIPLDEPAPQPGPAEVAPPDGQAAAMDEPCATCSAPCCSTLTFPVDRSPTLATYDRLRFSLGYPDVELAVGPKGWAIAVHTTCRHLVDGRCAAYGTPERPLRCSYYDAYTCTYKAAFEGDPDPGYQRVTRDQLDAFLRDVEA